MVELYIYIDSRLPRYALHISRTAATTAVKKLLDGSQDVLKDLEPPPYGLGQICGLIKICDGGGAPDLFKGNKWALGPICSMISECISLPHGIVVSGNSTTTWEIDPHTRLRITLALATKNAIETATLFGTQKLWKNTITATAILAEPLLDASPPASSAPVHLLPASDAAAAHPSDGSVPQSTTPPHASSPKPAAPPPLPPPLEDAVARGLLLPPSDAAAANPSDGSVPQSTTPPHPGSPKPAAPPPLPPQLEDAVAAKLPMFRCQNPKCVKTFMDSKAAPHEGLCCGKPLHDRMENPELFSMVPLPPPPSGAAASNPPDVSAPPSTTRGDDVELDKPEPPLFYHQKWKAYGIAYRDFAIRSCGGDPTLFANGRFRCWQFASPR